MVRAVLPFASRLHSQNSLVSRWNSALTFTATTTQQAGACYLVLARVRPTRAGDVWENLRPPCWRAVPVNVTWEGGRHTELIIFTPRPQPSREYRVLDKWSRTSAAARVDREQKESELSEVHVWFKRVGVMSLHLSEDGGQHMSDKRSLGGSRERAAATCQTLSRRK